MYRDLNDYEMLYLISDNNDDEYEIMQEKYNPLISKIVKKYSGIVKKMGYEPEDLFQIGYITLYQTISGYDGNKNDNLFYTYFSKALEHAFLGLIRINSTNKKKTLNESISYDNKFPNSNLTYAEIFPDTDSLIAFDLDNVISRYYNLKNSLDFNTSCILDLKIEGFCNNEIAILLDIPVGKIYEAVRLIKEKSKLF